VDHDIWISTFAVVLALEYIHSFNINNRTLAVMCAERSSAEVTRHIMQQFKDARSYSPTETALWNMTTDIVANCVRWLNKHESVTVTPSPWAKLSLCGEKECGCLIFVSADDKNTRFQATATADAAPSRSTATI